MAELLVEDNERERVSGIKWLITARLIVILLCLFIVLMRGLSQPDPGLGAGSVLLLLVSLLILNFGYLLILPYVRNAILLFVAVQFLVDIGVESGLVFFTGGVESNFVNLYYLSIIAAPMLLSRRDSAIFASLATVCLAIIYILYRTNTGLHLVDPLYHPALSEHLLSIAHWKLILITVSFFVIAFLSGLLAQRLELERILNEEVLQNMAEGLAVFDNRNLLLYVNNEFANLFSPSRSIRIGDSLKTVFFHPDDEPLRRLISSRTAARFDLEVCSHAGVKRPPVEVRTSSLGNAIVSRGMIMLAIDLSNVRRAEEAEFQAARFSAVTEMAASLAHEIRNPLASVRGSVQEISRNFPEGSSDAKLAAIVLKESDRLDRIITSFLQYSRTRQLHPRDCDLRGVLEEIKLLLENRPDRKQKNIELQVTGSPRLRADSEQLKEVFLNLGINALAALDAEGTLVIRCPGKSPAPSKLTVPRAGVSVSFIDDGRGLPPGAAGRIFEPFYTTKATGSGLGLAVAQRVVKAHEGEIWAEGQPDQGAIFTVWLPLTGPFKSGVPVLPSSPSEAS